MWNEVNSNLNLDLLTNNSSAGTHIAIPFLQLSEEGMSPFLLDELTMALHGRKTCATGYDGIN